MNAEAAAAWMEDWAKRFKGATARRMNEIVALLRQQEREKRVLAKELEGLPGNCMFAVEWEAWAAEQAKEEGK